MKKFLRFLVILFKVSIPLALLGSIAIICVIFYYLAKVPDVSKMNEEGYELVSRLYTKDGKHIDDYYKTTRHYIPLSELPPHVINAFLAAEDANFYENIGIDIKGIFRAMLQNVKSLVFRSSGYQGASTITQQLVKNILLTNEKTIERKIKEMILSVMVTKELPKQKILELYLNYIFFGSNAYGIQSAALEYFDKNAKDLNIQEAATLAAMPKAPSVINPKTNYERTLSRRNWIIDQMVINQFVDSKSASVAKESPIDYIKHRSSFRENSGGYNSISQHIATVEAKKLKLDDIYTHGYFIKTTIDSQIQEHAFKVVQKRLDAYQEKYQLPTNQIVFSKNDWCKELAELSKKYTKFTLGVAISYKNSYNITVGILNGTTCKTIETIALDHIPLKMGILALERQTADDIAKLRLPESVEKIFAKNPVLAKPIPQPNAGVVVMHLQTGKILAMVGDYFDTPNGFNRVTQAYRQVGSTIKPFVYHTALENGFTPVSKFIDAPITLGTNWKPQNHSHDYLGAVTLRRALERSRNIPTVRIADALELKTLKNTFINLDFVDNKSAFDLSSALGSTSITPLTLMMAYSIYPNGGRKVSPSFIEYIQDRKGNIVYQNSSTKCEGCSNVDGIPSLKYTPQSKQIVSPQVAFQMNSILEGVFLRGTASHTSKWVGQYMAGKTGTTNNAKDSWFVGYNSKVIVAVYVGFDDSHSLGNHEYGATLALPIFVDIMSQLTKKYPNSPFKAPDGIIPIAVHKETGERAHKYGDGIITEYFKEGDAIPDFTEQKLDLYGY